MKSCLLVQYIQKSSVGQSCAFKKLVKYTLALADFKKRNTHKANYHSQKCMPADIFLKLIRFKTKKLLGPNKKIEMLLIGWMLANLIR
jgi:hypothetical protein